MIHQAREHILVICLIGAVAATLVVWAISPFRGRDWTPPKPAQIEAQLKTNVDVAAQSAQKSF